MELSWISNDDLIELAEYFYSKSDRDLDLLMTRIVGRVQKDIDAEDLEQWVWLELAYRDNLWE